MNEIMILWIIVLIVTLVIEIGTLGLTTIWFTGGAMGALIVEILGGNIYVQLAVFLILSLVLLCFTRPVAVKYFNRERTTTNLDRLIGKKAVVTADIWNLQESGMAAVDGMEWTARSKNAEDHFVQGQIVRITAIQGVKLIVEADEEKN